MLDSQNAAALDCMRRVGRLVAQCLDMLSHQVAAGVSPESLDHLAFEFAKDHKAIPALSNIHGYSHATCISINHVVCHGIPTARPLREGDIFSLEVVLLLDGWHASSSRMFTIGAIPSRAERLIAVAHEAMKRAISVVEPGATVGDIGHAIQACAEAHQMSVVRDFCGHGIGRLLHDEPQILNFGTPREGAALQAGMFLTIHPMINLGRPHVKVLSDGFTTVTRDRSLSAQLEHTIAITENGAEILTLPEIGKSSEQKPEHQSAETSGQHTTLNRTEEVKPDTSSFDLLCNPFVLLGLTPAATARDINRAYEEAIEVGEHSVDLLQRAQQALLAPRLRIDAEVGGLLNVAPDLVIELRDKLKRSSNREALTDLLYQLPALAKSNVLAHFAARSAARPSEILELVETQTAIKAEAVHDAVTDARAQAKIGKVDLQTVLQALSKLEARQAKAVVDKLVEEGAFADSVTAFVRRAIRGENELLIAKLDAYVRTYSDAVSPELFRRREPVTAACEAIRGKPKDAALTDRLLNALQHWNEIAEPLQMYEGRMLRDEPFTREIYEQIRSLCIWLNDKQQEYKLAHRITLACIDTFKALPRAVAQMQEHAAIYSKNLRAQESNAATRREMELHFSDKKWQQAQILIDRLLEIERDPNEIEALRKMRDVCKRELEGFNSSGIQTQEAQPYEVKVELANAGVAFGGTLRLEKTSQDASSEAAQKAYQAAKGRRDEVGATNQSAQRPDHEASATAQQAYQAARGRKDEVGSRTTKGQSAGAHRSGSTRDARRDSSSRTLSPGKSVAILAIILIIMFAIGKSIESGANKSVASPPQPTPPAVLAFSVTKALVASNIDSAGQLLGVGSSFRGPKTSIVGYVSFINGKVGSDAIVLSLVGNGVRNSCNRRIIQYASAHFWCKWNDVGTGTYRIEIRVNDRVLNEVPFTVTRS